MGDGRWAQKGQFAEPSGDSYPEEEGILGGLLATDINKDEG